MKQIFLIGAGFLLLAIGAYDAFAQNRAAIQYPVAELGNCANEQECRTYCDDLKNIKQCVAFAEKHNLLSVEELAEAKRFERFGVESGPGGCTSEVGCEAYCEDISHINECLAFAEQHGVLEGHDLQEAKKVARALQSGAQLPGGCQTKAECERYCEEPSHINECLAFAEAAGFMSPEELEDARRVAPFMARGEMPGGCRSREECETYCAQEAHTNECADFFVKAGFISAQEAELFRKTGGRGPGGCQGKEECEAFCNNPANQQVCFDFGREHGLVPEEDLHNIEEGLQRLQEGFSNAPPEVRQCLDSAVGEGVINRILSRELLPSQEIGDHMRRCFEEFLPESFEGEHGEGGGFGPGPEGDFGPPPEAAGCIQSIIGDRPTGPPTPEQEQRIRQECFPEQPEHSEDFENFREVEDVLPPAGEVPEEFRDQFREEFDQQFQEEFERQFQEEFDRQFQEEFQHQFEQQAPEGFQPPEEFHEEPPPEARNPHQRFLGAVWGAMKPGLQRLIAK